MALSGAETDRGGPHMDSEGTILGGSRSKKRAALDLGIAYVTGKVADDLLEEGIKSSGPLQHRVVRPPLRVMLDSESARCIFSASGAGTCDWRSTPKLH